MKRKLSGAEKRRRKRARAMEQLRKFIEENPTPYHDYHDRREYFRRRVAEALRDHPGFRPRWRPGRNSRWSKIIEEDLSIALHAVDAVGRRGISYGQLRCAFMVNSRRGCHRAKASVIFAALVNLGLIRKTVNYSTGRRGNVYRMIDEQPDVDEFMNQVFPPTDGVEDEPKEKSAVEEDSSAEKSKQ